MLTCNKNDEISSFSHCNIFELIYPPPKYNRKCEDRMATVLLHFLFLKMEGNWILESLIISHFTLNNIVRFRRISHMNEHSEKKIDNENHPYFDETMLTCMEIEILRFFFLLNEVNLHTNILQNENRLYKLN